MPPKPRVKPEAAPPSEATEPAAEGTEPAATEPEAAEGVEPEPAAEAAAPAAAEPAEAPAAEPAEAPAAEPAAAEAPAAEPAPGAGALAGLRVRVLFTERKAEPARALRERLLAGGAVAFLVDVTGMPALERHANTAYLHPKAQGLAEVIRAELGGVSLRAQANPGEDHVFVWVV